MTKHYYKECVGCGSQRICTITPIFKIDDEIHKCPCLYCSDKETCAHGCNDYRHYRLINRDINKNKLCIGCITAPDCQLPARIDLEDECEECPCMSCLIKSMCCNSCQDYREYSEYAGVHTK